MTKDRDAGGHATVFDRVAAEYDRSRPTYPEELIDHACNGGDLATGDRVIEVGCGTGQLTRSLVKRGLDVVAVEPGRNMVAALNALLRTTSLYHRLPPGQQQALQRANTEICERLGRPIRSSVLGVLVTARSTPLTRGW